MLLSYVYPLGEIFKGRFHNLLHILYKASPSVHSKDILNEFLSPSSLELDWDKKCQKLHKVYAFKLENIQEVLILDDGLQKSLKIITLDKGGRKSLL